MMLLLPALVKHLLEELELGVCACEEEERCGEEGKDSRHLGGNFRGSRELW